MNYVCGAREDELRLCASSAHMHQKKRHVKFRPNLNGKNSKEVITEKRE